MIWPLKLEWLQKEINLFGIYKKHHILLGIHIGISYKSYGQTKVWQRWVYELYRTSAEWSGRKGDKSYDKKWPVPLRWKFVVAIRTIKILSCLKRKGRLQISVNHPFLNSHFLNVKLLIIRIMIVLGTLIFPLRVLVLMFPPFQVRLHSPANLEGRSTFKMSEYEGKLKWKTNEKGQGTQTWFF